MGFFTLSYTIMTAPVTKIGNVAGPKLAPTGTALAIYMSAFAIAITDMILELISGEISTPKAQRVAKC